MITRDQISAMRKSLLRKIEMKVGDKIISGIWSDIEIETSTGEITGVYVDKKCYGLKQIDYFRTK